MVRSKKGQAIGEAGRSGERVKELKEFTEEAEAQSDLKTWRRGRAVLGYLDGKSVDSIASELGSSRSAVKKWIRRYDMFGVAGLWTRRAPGRPCRLSEAQREELVSILKAGPEAAGFTCGLWNGPMVGQLIEQRFDIHYHNQHVPKLLHELGFSVQRPRKLLARADKEAQQQWCDVRLPAIEKKSRSAVESSFSRTRRASGWTARSIRPGRLSGFSSGCRPMDCGRPHMYSAP